MGTYTAKRQILSRANLIIIAVGTGVVFTTARTALQKNHFTAQDGADGFYDFFDIVAAFDREGALVAVIIQPQMDQRDKFFFFQPRKFERFAIQNQNHD
ncbi:MAG: hypothetical protein ACM3UN_04445 [Bacillota bacterium]